MTSSATFPAICATNTYLLPEFADIVYIVCTHAIPAASGNNANVNSSKQILNRLRNAEHNFRQTSILAALDSEKLELFTFYRTTDVRREQKTILNKFGNVCRLNTCIVASKNSVRVVDLLKAENARVHQLFATAVFSSLQLSTRTSTHAVAVNKRIYLVPIPGEADTLSNVRGRTWLLQRVNLEIFQNGQLTLTVQTSSGPTLNAFAGRHQHINVSDDAPVPATVVYLVPYGQMAKYTGGWTGTTAQLQETDDLKQKFADLSAKNRHSSIMAVTEWMKKTNLSRANFKEEDYEWAEVELPVLESQGDENAKLASSTEWKVILWPTSMIYTFASPLNQIDSRKQTAMEADPLKFIQDWFTSSQDGSSTVANVHSSGEINGDAREDENLFSEDVHFEDHNQLFGAPNFASSQTVYPTPPEVGLAHPTPGMSSADGMAPTPAYASQAIDGVPDAVEHEMQDITDSQHGLRGSIGSGDDLFEDMPDDKYETAPTDNEPNWDFFNSREFDGSIGDDTVNGQHDEVVPGTNHDVSSLDKDKQPKHEYRSPSPMSAPKRSPDPFESPEEKLIHKTAKEPNSNDIIDDSQQPTDRTSPTLKDQHQSGSKGQDSHRVLHQTTKNKRKYSEHSSTAQQKNGSSIGDVRRRSSTFDGISGGIGPRDHDDRYSAYGKYYFDTTHTIHPSLQSDVTPKYPHRPSSSSSDTSMSSVDDDYDDDDARQPTDSSQPIPKVWAEYQAGTPAEEAIDKQDTEDTSLNEITSSLLDVISSATGEDPFELDVLSALTHRKRPHYDASKASMVAQILVDQVSQSSLLKDEQDMCLTQIISAPQVDLSIDYSGSRANIKSATLADLTTSPSHGQTPIKVDSKVYGIENPRVCVNRADEEITSNLSILSFWDLLSLQPLGGVKDVTAFCMFPASNNISDGCHSFLNRIGDTYGACNLGNHNAGRLAGVTNDGMVAWTPQSTAIPNLRQACQRLGNAIASSGSSEGTIVIYMISPSKDWSNYREVCNAFTLLFECFRKAPQKQSKQVELVLQIIPVSFVSSPEVLVIPSQDEYFQLAIEIYNRIPPQPQPQPQQQHSQLAHYGSAMVLEKAKNMQPFFELSDVAGSPLSKDGQCLHLAYAYSADKSWVTATWSDEQGAVALTMSYQFQARHNAGQRPRSEILRDMFEVSLDLIRKERSKWQLVVAKSGVYSVEEVNEWLHLVNHNIDERKGISRLILLEVDLEPEIQVWITGSSMRLTHMNGAPQHINTVATPISTPQMSTTSPDQNVGATPTSAGLSQLNNALTPPDTNLDSTTEAEHILIDTTEESWCAILPFAFSRSRDSQASAPTLAHSLLLKRTGPKQENEMLAALGVNFINTSRPQAASLTQSDRENILHEMVVQYRRLVTLAAVRGCTRKDVDCVPWHVATAVRGSRVLGEVI